MAQTDLNLARAGAELRTARAAVILVHGRGASAVSMLDLAAELVPEGEEHITFLAPQAPGGVWYPYSFMSAIEQNEPGLSHSLQTLSGVLAHAEAAGLPADKVALVGFSQGACLSLEYAARHPVRYGGVAGLSGGLIGPDGTRWSETGAMQGTPVFLGCSDIDPHIPLKRVHETEDVFAHLGTQVTTRIYPGMGHTVNQDELEFVRRMLAMLVQ